MDMQPENQTASMPTLCRAGCGFYGSSATENLCSKCFRDALKRKQDPNRQSAGATLFSASPSSSLASAESILDETVASNDFLNVEKHHDESATLAPSTKTAALPQAPAAPSSDGPIAAGAPSSSSAIETATSRGAVCDGLAAPSTPSGSSDDAATATAAPPPTTTKPRNRCETCNKKVGFTGFECRCGGVFCGAHRYSDLHKCQFDYKSLGAQEIQKNNPVIAKEKIQKI